MFFLNPTYLWALLGLAVPVAIHLWSKKEGRTIKIGSIQLLQETDPKQTSNINLNELWLLLLRMLLITILVLILAEPQFKTEADNVPVTYLVEPSLLSFDEVNSIIDTIDQGASVKLLQKDFPEYQKEGMEERNFSTPNYWQLADEMQDLATDSIVVFTNAIASGFKGMRPKIKENINWVVLDPGEPKEGYIEATRKGDQVELVSVSRDHQNLKFEKEVVSPNSDKIIINGQSDSISISAENKETWLPLKTADSLQVLLFYDENRLNEMRYLRSSFLAISQFLEIPVEVQTIKDVDSLEVADYSKIAWLSETPVIKTDVPVLVYKPDSLAGSLIEQGNSENVFHLTRSLNSENIIENHLPERLLAFLDLHQDLEGEIGKYDRRVMDREELLPVTAGIGRDKNLSEYQNFSQYLWILLGILLIAERGLARYRKQ